jgi:uncharacterized glyoxalase superfamily protein PhnB
MVRVDDAHAHCQRAREHGARVVRDPTEVEHRERQYTSEDPARHQWTFSERSQTSRRRNGAGNIGFRG